MKSVGETAPAFTLPGMTADADDIDLYHVDEKSLDSPVILAFYLFDFHPACTRSNSVTSTTWTGSTSTSP